MSKIAKSSRWEIAGITRLNVQLPRCTGNADGYFIHSFKRRRCHLSLRFHEERTNKVTKVSESKQTDLGKEENKSKQTQAENNTQVID